MSEAISIHALRVEGDLIAWSLSTMLLVFLSTPSGWRATKLAAFLNKMVEISIHALRVEGDQGAFEHTGYNDVISIHALRVEGDDE